MPDGRRGKTICRAPACGRSVSPLGRGGAREVPRASGLWYNVPMSTNDLEKERSVAVLIDADNVSAMRAGEILSIVSTWGEPLIRRAYGAVNRFTPSSKWADAQRVYGILSCPQVNNIPGKNAADIALVIDAMEALYKSACDGICVVSSDSDFTALATKIREGGKDVYGIGGTKTPKSFRSACTAFVTLANVGSGGVVETAQSVPTCPRCGKPLEKATTKSRQPCLHCANCGGVAVKMSVLQSGVATDSIDAMKELVRAHEALGCNCPKCGASMSLIRVEVGKKRIEIDICRNCWTVWYDKDEFESIVPQDGVLQAKVSAGKAFRRETVVMVTADLRSGRCRADNIGVLNTILKRQYHVPNPDVEAVVSALRSQKVITIDKRGKVEVQRLPPA